MLPKLVQPAEYEWGERHWVKLEELAKSLGISIEQAWQQWRHYWVETESPQQWLDGPEGTIHHIWSEPKALYRVFVPRSGMRRLMDYLLHHSVSA